MRFPGGPLTTGPWSNGKTPPWRGGDLGSIPSGSTRYGRQPDIGWPGHPAKVISSRRGGFDSLAFRLCPDGETDITPRFERGDSGFDSWSGC